MAKTETKTDFDLEGEREFRPAPDSVGLVERQTVRLFEPPHPLMLECGRELGPIDVAFETYGTLNERRDNAILICHALSGDAHAAGWNDPSDRKPGWWDLTIGPGKPFDTDRYFMICSNVLGGCKGTTGPLSINPDTGRPWGLGFPLVTISDMVRVQAALLDHLGVERLLCVTGGSMGGMQALEWMARYPERLRSTLILASAAHMNAQAIAFDAVGRYAILADPALNRDGAPPSSDTPIKGLSVARMLAHISYLSDQAMQRKFGRELRSSDDYKYDFGVEFEVESYLDYQGERFVQRFDALSYLYITKAMNYFDLEREHGSLEAAFERMKGAKLVLSFTSDWLYPAYQSREMVRSLLKSHTQVSYCNVESTFGHDSFLLDVPVMHDMVRRFLDRIASTAPEEVHPPPSLGDGLPAIRDDQLAIAQLVPRGSRVLDLGCGDGALLAWLRSKEGVTGVGIEKSETDIADALGRGVNVLQADLDRPLDLFEDDSFDLVVISQTLQTVHRPGLVVREALRLAPRAVVSFPNFGHWRTRTSLSLRGVTPVTGALPYEWWESSNIKFFTMQDFHRFCDRQGIRIHSHQALSEPETPGFLRGLARLWPNMFAHQLIYLLERG